MLSLDSRSRPDTIFAQMTPTFEEAHDRVKKLAADFEAHKGHYLSPGYTEAQLRQDFLDKFLIALGWDVRHEEQKNPFAQEVHVESNVTIGTSQRRADYGFYVAPKFGKGDLRFYVEAKKPFGDIANKDFYFQTIRYGWNSKTPLAILTDFEQLHILDCRYKPVIDDVLPYAVFKFHYTEYADETTFRKIWHLFARDEVAAGSLEKYAAGMPKKRGKAAARHTYQEIDDAFLEDLDGFRDALAKNFKNQNPDLDGETLTELTQRVIDRLVFLRFLEDKGIETRESVGRFGLKGPAWSDFVAASRRLDGIYNGIVYKEHPLLDSPKFAVDDAAFAKICQELSPARSAYDFDKIPIHILGSIYERFLGKVIVTTDKRARVEEKPEVRKAGGVYYTPEYIVRYIVDQTVGKQIAGKSPRQIEPLRFADIACGSGSFLLGVFDCLLRHHRDWYNANPERAQKDKCILREDGAWHLSLKQRREILLHNIYGVDIDHQAVEVAQLSLYLKLLEDETTATARAHQLEFHETLLPSLNKNIVCGNSLIGTDILDGQLLPPEEQRRMNTMDFEFRFPQVFRAKPAAMMLHDTPAAPLGFDMPGVPMHGSYATKKKKVKAAAEPAPAPGIEDRFEGGFDAIVGNPPYVRQEGLSAIKHYLETHYESFDGTADLYTYFMEKCLRLLKPGGVFSYIVSSGFLRTNFGEPLRRFLKKAGTVQRIVDFGGLPVFESAKDTYVCIPIIAKGAASPSARTEICKVNTLKLPDLAAYVSEHSFSVPPSRLSPEAWALKSDAENAVFEKVMRAGEPLGEFIQNKLFYGLKTGLNEAFVVSSEQRNGIVAQQAGSAALIKPFLGGEDIRRYLVEDDGKLLIVLPNGWTRAQMSKAKGGTTSPSEKSAWEWLSTAHSGIAMHLAAFTEPLRKRQDQGEFWWELRPCDYYAYFDRPKIIFPDICKEPRFVVDRSGIYLANTAYCIGSDSLYLLGVLNSRVFWFVISNISIPFGIRAGKYRYRLIYQYMEKVPIRPIDESNPADKQVHDRMVKLVEQMLEAKRQWAGATTEANREYYNHRCADLDRQIDTLVYALYSLTPEEIEVVEDATG
jgi:type I restriction-modification system DNA methylase subunit